MKSQHRTCQMEMQGKAAWGQETQKTVMATQYVKGCKCEDHTGYVLATCNINVFV